MCVCQREKENEYGPGRLTSGSLDTGVFFFYFCSKPDPMHRIQPILILLSFLLSQSLLSQEKEAESPLTIPMVYASYGFFFPGGDMADRFGSASVLGPGFMVKNSTNWIYGLHYDYLFGNNVKDGFSILENLLTSEGILINGDGVPATVALFERGHLVSGRFGKLFPVTRTNLNSGVFFTVGLGYLTHKIKIEVENQSAPQLKGDYRRGYDRLTGGFMLNQTIGYMYFGKARLMNLFIGVEITEAFTKSLRDYHFDTMAGDDSKRFDLMVGPRISWIIPFRKRLAKEFYYY